LWRESTKPGPSKNVRGSRELAFDREEALAKEFVLCRRELVELGIGRSQRSHAGALLGGSARRTGRTVRRRRMIVRTPAGTPAVRRGLPAATFELLRLGQRCVLSAQLAFERGGLGGERGREARLPSSSPPSTMARIARRIARSARLSSSAGTATYAAL
jgi:hypothetical protein